MRLCRWMGAAVAAAVATGSHAATFDFRSSNGVKDGDSRMHFTAGGMTLTAAAYTQFILNPTPSKLKQTGHGLGVKDWDSIGGEADEIDNDPFVEAITFTSDTTFSLHSITLSKVQDRDDALLFAIDADGDGVIGSLEVLTIDLDLGTGVTRGPGKTYTLDIAAILGAPLTTNAFAILPAFDVPFLDDNDFAIQSMDITTIPLPAASLAGLGGLVVLAGVRRR